MPLPKGCAFDDSLPASSALLLCGVEMSPEDRNLTRLFDFFRIPWKTAGPGDGGRNECQGRYAVVSSADCLARAIQNGQSSGGGILPPLLAKASAVYVYGLQGNEWSNKLLRQLTGNLRATVRPINTSEAIMAITADSPAMCGPMSGMQVPVSMRTPGCVCDLGLEGEKFQSVVRTDAGEVFFGVTCAGVRFYVNAWDRTLDIDALSAEYFDVKKSFCEAVPITFFLKWAFRDAGLGQHETTACLIVDDPPLKRRYGFLDFREALQLMDRHNFATTIAFIPWNWRRTHPGTLSLFRSHPERLSVVVHGCDHTGGEFGLRSPALLNRKIRTSKHRMESFRRRAAIEADNVMVFPQGVFSPETGRALKLNEFAAAVNTEVAPSQGSANETTISDLWNIAIMRYGTFPIFTRRYLHHGIENFAFDAILGKPCLIAAHHDVFKYHARDLVEFVARLNSLKWNLVWRPLGEAIRRSFTIRRLDDGTRVIQMFAGSAMVENQDTKACRTVLLKEEADSDCVEAVWVNQKAVEFDIEGRYLRVEQTLRPGETIMVRIAYRNNLEATPSRDSPRTRIKVAAKRYLSEFRDNYLSRSDFLYQSATKLKRLIK
jgi:hypothetical protein